MNQFLPREEYVYYEVTRHMTQNRLQKARRIVGLYGFFLIAAVAALIPAIEYVSAHAAASGFSEYVSLIVSDGDSLAGSWGALMLSLIDSAPILGIALILASLTVAAYCIRKFALSRHVLYRTII